MNFVPSKRLLWAVALTVVPAALVLGMAGASVAMLAVLVGVIAVGLAVIDAVVSPRICSRGRDGPVG